jgi:hypothetical protein
MTTLTDLIAATVAIETRKLLAAEAEAEAERARLQAEAREQFMRRLESRFGAIFLDATGRELVTNNQGVALTFEHGDRRFVLRYSCEEVAYWHISEPDHRNVVTFSDGDQVPHRVLLYVAALTDQAGDIRDDLMVEFFS